MQNLELHLASKQLKGTIQLPGSKSESNRALIINSLCPNPAEIIGLSNADDTETLQKALLQHSPSIDIGPAGTAMRFLTARLAIKKGTFTLTGSKRMLERPIGILVNALQELGANIAYNNQKGYPPLTITGSENIGGEVSLDGSVSSQYISALCLIAPTLKNGIKINFTTELISRPYLEMTLAIMKKFGVSSYWQNNSLVIEHQTYISNPLVIEPDWSSASYWYSLAALSDHCELLLPGFSSTSLQGDHQVATIFNNFGVSTNFLKNGIFLSKTPNFTPSKTLVIDCVNFPDLAQTIAVTAAALQIDCTLTGLQSLRIKETDRIAALISELAIFGITAIAGDNNSLKISPGPILPPIRAVQTYHDHRMAMAFAPLLLKVGSLTIENPMVVSKSYPNSWKDLQTINITV